MSHIHLDPSIFDRLEAVGFKHHGWFLSDMAGNDYGEQHHFTHPQGLRLETKFSWTEPVRWCFGWSTGGGKYAWGWCDYPSFEACLRPIIALLFRHERLGDALNDPLRSHYVPDSFRALAAAANLAVRLGIPIEPLGPRCYPEGFHFTKQKRRAFFERHFKHWTRSYATRSRF